MNHPEYLEYKEFEEEMRDTLEAQFSSAMVCGKKDEAYQALGKLMEYKLIEKDDARIEKNNASYTSGLIQADHRFPYDYRKEFDYIPSWLFGRLGVAKVFSCNTIEHWGKRVEGNYSGDVKFNSGEMKIRVSLCRTNRQVEQAFVNIDKTLQGKKKSFDAEESLGLTTNGVHRVYSITVESNCLPANKHLGEALIKMTDGGIEINLILRYDAFINNWLPLYKCACTISDTVKALVGGSDDEQAIVKYEVDIAESVVQQSTLTTQSESTGVNSERIIRARM